jgi:ATP-dependent DNA helicase RecQ
MFLELMRWAEGGSCRHDTILRYFGDEAETLAGCGRCDVCVELAEGEADGGGAAGDAASRSAEETTLLVRKALSGVARVHGRYGMGLAVKLLKGLDDERLLGSGLCNTSTFGVLSDRSEDWLLRLLRRCVTAGWVDFRGGDRPVVVLTEEGREVMHGRRAVRLLLPATQPRRARRGARGARGTVHPAPERRARPGLESEVEVEVGGDVVGSRWRPARRAAAGPADEEELDDDAMALFEALRRHRLEVAREQSVPPYVVASDRTLRDIARRRPATLAELQEAHGIGPAKAERYGEGLLAVVGGRSP